MTLVSLTNWLLFWKLTFYLHEDHCTDQSFSTSALLTLLIISCGGGCPMFLGYLLTPRSLITQGHCRDDQNISRHCRMSPGGQNSPQLRITKLDLIQFYKETINPKLNTGLLFLSHHYFIWSYLFNHRYMNSSCITPYIL